MAKTTPRDLTKADALVCKVLEIVGYFHPKVWWVENPQTGLLKDRPMMKNIPFVDIDYCQFSDWGYKKPTRFWGSSSIGRLPPVRCPGKECPNTIVEGHSVKHKEKLGGYGVKFGTVAKGRIPSKVVDFFARSRICKSQEEETP